MKITKVELKHTNPSLGPHERIITYSMYNNDEHEQEFEQLLQRSTVNGSYSMINFLEAHKNKDEKTIKEITSINKDKVLPKGGVISKFTITLEAELQVEVSDLRTIYLGGYYSTFIPYLVKHGHKFEYSSWEKPISPEEKPKSFDKYFNTSIEKFLEEDDEEETQGNHVSDR
jgi:transcriptional regulatory protein LevR